MNRRRCRCGAEKDEGAGGAEDGTKNPLMKHFASALSYEGVLFFHVDTTIVRFFELIACVESLVFLHCLKVRTIFEGSNAISFITFHTV
jgi:hypothetical protein